MNKFAILVVSAFALAACQENKQPDSDKSQKVQTEMLAKEADMKVPMPNITNFTEKRLVKELYELRDQPNYRTYTYLVTLDGRLVKVCDSVGYGINASIQFSNPEKVVKDAGFNDSTFGTLPQAEPNALFMPEGLAATYVMCLDPKSQEVKAVYLEPEIVVSPFEINLVP